MIGCTGDADIEYIDSLDTTGGVAPTIVAAQSCGHIRYIGGIAFIIAPVSISRTYYYSTDHGENWDSAETPSDGGTYLADIARLDSGRWVALGTGSPAKFMYSDEDIPLNWTLGPATNGGSGGDAAGYLISSGDAIVSFTNQEYVMRSTDGATWTKLATGLVSTSDARDGVYADGVFVGGVAQRGSVVRSCDAGLTWAEVFLTGTQTTAAVNRLEYGDGIVVAMQSTAGDYYYSTDKGATWTAVTGPLPSPRIGYLT